MAAPVISVLPDAPTRQNPADFAAKADALLLALNPWTLQLNTLGSYMNTTALSVESHRLYVQGNVPLMNNAVAAAPLALSYRDTAKTYRDAAAASEAKALQYKNDAASAVVYQDLASVALSKNIVMVAGCIDTSPNPSLAVQRGTSWYAELGPMPTRKVLIAEANKLTIYDGDDPSFPEWCVFPFFVGAGSAIRSVDMENSVIGVAITNTSSIGMTTINFGRDEMTVWFSTGHKTSTKGIASRPTDQASWGVFYQGDYSGKSLPSSAGNKVFFKTLDNAPLDPVSGLQTPTLWLCTANGVFQLGWDGRQYGEWTLTHSDNSNMPDGIAHDDGTFSYVCSAFLHRRPVITKDEALGGRFVRNPSDIMFVPYIYSDTYVTATAVVPTLASSSFGLIPAGQYIAVSSGLVRYEENPSAADRPATFAHITSDYNTGVMARGCKGAYLASTGTDPMTEYEYATPENHLFIGEAGLATYDAATQTYYATRTANDGTGTIGFNVPMGAHVLVDAEVTSGDPLLVRDGGRVIKSFTARETFRFTASEGSVRFNHGSAPLSSNFKVHSITVLVEDRSLSNRGLSIQGVVQRTPVETGAELVAYGPFSLNNHFTQEFNPELPEAANVNTLIECWVYRLNSASGGMLEFGDNVSGKRRLLYQNASGDLMWNTGNGQIQAFGSLKTLCWQKVTVLHDENDMVYIWIDGELAANGYIERLEPSGTGGLTVGGFISGASVSALNGKMALVRISEAEHNSATERQNYALERPMFQRNSKVTLHGSSNVIYGLSYDKATDLLHAGTSAGRSEFSGLVRVGNTESAVNTMIAAHDGIILEQ